MAISQLKLKQMKKMKFTSECFHQGDTQWFKLSNLPPDMKKIKKRFIAASEKSGSLHALFGKYDMYEMEDGFVVDVKEECILNHSLQKDIACSMDESKILPKKDHRHTVVEKGVYFVGIQQRFDPLSGLKQKVRD